MILLRDARSIARQLRDIVEHDFALLRDRDGPVVFLRCLYQPIIQSDSTQKLCVGFDSIVTAIDEGITPLLSARLDIRNAWLYPLGVHR